MHTVVKCRLDQVIILVRNPVKVFIAEFNRRTAGKMKETAPSEFMMRGWSQFVLEQISEYEGFYMYWVRSQIPKKVVCFEHLEKDPVNITTNLTDFMRVPSRKNCLEKNTEGCLHRHHNEEYTYGHLFNTTVRSGSNSEFAFPESQIISTLYQTKAAACS